MASNLSPPPLTATKPPPSSPDSDSTIVIVVFVSFGSLFLLAFLLVALCCFIKKMKKTKRESQEIEILRGDEHLNVKKAEVDGPHGTKAVVLTIDEDIHLEEAIKKNERFGESTSNSDSHHFDHKDKHLIANEA